MAPPLDALWSLCLRGEKMKATSVAATLLAVCLSTPAWAEMVPVEKIAGWELVKDADPIFGDVGYRLDLSETSGSDASTLSLLCTFEEEGTISYSIQLASSAVNLGEAGMSGKIGSLLRFDDGDIRQAEWLVSNGSSVLSYSSGGSNFVADNDNPRFKEAVRAGNAGQGGHLGRMLAIGMLANGIQMFYWNVSVSQQLALGFGSGPDRRSLLFDLGEGAAAVERLLGICRDAADARAPKDTRSPRERAPWSSLDNTRGEYRTIGLDSKQCLELHPVRHRRGDPLTVVDSDSPGDVLTATAGGTDLVIEGPRRRLEVYFGKRASEGRFQYRTWTRQAASCAED